MYRISLLVAGGVALYLDGQIVLAGEREAARFIDGPLLPLQAEVELSGERPLELRLDYTAAPAVFPPQLTLGWQTPGGSLIDGATAAAGATDVAVVFVTSAEGEGMDRSSLTLAGDQDRLVRAVAAANPKTVVVVNSGGPVLMPWLDEVAAVLQVWYPGEQYGRALTDVLFGDADPGGRLPVTFPATEQQGPASRAVPRRYPGVDRTVRYDEETLVGYRWFDATGQEPLFPFGFGLSYASIQIEGAQLTTRQDDSLCVAVSLTNHAVRPGTEVVQVYVEPPSGPEPRTRRLAAFAKVDLAASASTSLELEIPRAALATFRTDSGWEVAAGSYAIWAGLSSRDLEECGSLLIERAARCDDPWIAA
jgi:beta-glucosidase